MIEIYQLAFDCRCIHLKTTQRRAPYFVTLFIFCIVNVLASFASLKQILTNIIAFQLILGGE
jgi:hypothetical protein